MPLFMDVHTLGEGAAAEEAIAFCKADFAARDRFGVSCLRYWVSDTGGKVFCLLEADDLDLASTLHRGARGSIAREIYHVSEHAWHPTKSD